MAAYSRNVWVNVSLTCLNAAAQGFGWSTAAVTYLFLASGSSTVTVGWVEGAQGIVSVATAFPAGWAADRWRRDTVLRCCSVATVLASAVVALAVAHSLGWLALPVAQLPLIAAGYVLLGAAQGAAVPASDALLADSLATGAQRTRLMVRLGAWRSLLTAAGSAGLMFAFHLLGDHWTEHALAVVMGLTLVPGVLASALAWLYSDRRSLDTQSDAVQDLPDPTQQADEEDVGGSGWVAPLLALAELVLCLGAGMSVKFWPIFFLDPQAAALTPIQLNAVFCVSTIVKAQLILWAKALAGSLARCCAGALGGDGRMEAVLIFSLLGIGTRVLIALTPEWWGELPVIAALYILQTCLMNATHPLEKSVFMDMVSKSQRGRWAASDAVGMLGWSGSAAVGGWIIKRYGYSTLFLATSAVQLLGLVPKLAVCVIVAREGRRRGHSWAAEQEPGGGCARVGAGARCCDRLLWPAAGGRRGADELRQPLV